MLLKISRRNLSFVQKTKAVELELSTNEGATETAVEEKNNSRKMKRAYIKKIIH